MSVMRLRSGPALKRYAAALAALIALPAFADNPPSGHYRNFRVAIYIVVNTTKALADPASREAEFDRSELRIGPLAAVRNPERPRPG